MSETSSSLLEHLAFLYGEERAQPILEDLDALVVSRGELASSPHRFTEKDVALITYGDMVRRAGERPLATLGDFMTQHVADIISTVHILPFFPFSSDDGFAVIDYRGVDPNLGDWDDVRRIGRTFRLMFDGVINHISAESDWFQGFLRDDSRYREYFTVVGPDADTESVFRPRAQPLLTEVPTVTGPRHVWTTFGPDQVDLNYENPDVLLAVIDTLLFYVAQGASIIRLDAIAFIWKELGTPCVHLPETHQIIQLLRKVLDAVAPNVSIVTETNVPHAENISYFGDGTNESHMVYNFALPPLTLHAFQTGDARALSRWASKLEAPTGTTTFFNFLASHDGVGVGGARGLLTETEILQMAQRVEDLGGSVSYKTNVDDTSSVYELNINFLDALEDPAVPDMGAASVARRFLTSQAIMLALRGVPGVYFHSLFGSRGWSEGANQSGMPRTVNREKITRDTIEEELSDKGSLRHHVFKGFRQLLKLRASHPAFSPEADQYVIPSHDSVFALLRVTRKSDDFVLCLHNVSSRSFDVPLDVRGTPLVEPLELTNLVTGEQVRATGGMLGQAIEPYGTLWFVGRPSMD